MYILLCLVLKPEPVNPRERANLSACLCVDDTQRHSVPCTLSNSRSFSVSYFFFFHTHTCRDSLILHPQSHPHSTLRTDSRVHWRKQTCVWCSKWILWLCAASQMRVRHRSVPFVYFPGSHRHSTIALRVAILPYHTEEYIPLTSAKTLILNLARFAPCPWNCILQQVQFELSSVLASDWL